MALTFDFSAIADPTSIDHPADEHAMNPVADGMVWAMLIIGVGAINDKTLTTVQRRIRQVQLITGPMLGEIYITDADVERFKGLCTNVGTKTEAAFRTHLAKLLDEQQIPQQRSAWDIAAERLKSQAQKKDTQQ